MTEPRRRTTRQRLAIDAALRGVGEFVSAQAVHQRLRETGERIGLATVYRTLGQMIEDGRLDTVRTADGESLYRYCESDDHHHHLVCRSCGYAVEVSGPAVERWARSVGAAHDFTEVSHTVELFGLCGTCARREQGDNPAPEDAARADG